MRMFPLALWSMDGNWQKATIWLKTNGFWTIALPGIK